MIGPSTAAKLGLPLLAGIGLATAALVVLPGGSPAASIGARSWIDDPLSGSVLDESLTSIIAHSADPSGVGQVRFSVDGEQVATGSGKGARIALVSFTWDPEPGVHVLRVEATGVGGTVGLPGVATVTVGGEAPLPPDRDETATGTTTAAETTTTLAERETTTTSTSTSTPTSTSTSVPTTTSTTAPLATTTSPPRATTTVPSPTTTVPPATTSTTVGPCAPGTPVPTSPIDNAVVYTGPTLVWTAPAGCVVGSYEVQVSLSPAFDRLEASQTGIVATSWSPAPLTQCGPFYWRVRAVGAGIVPIFGPWSTTGSYHSGGRGC